MTALWLNGTGWLGSALILMMMAAPCAMAADEEPTPAAAAADAPRDIRIQFGDMDLYYQVDHGARLEVFGMRVFHGTTLWVMSPDWQTRHYGPIDPPDLIQKATVEDRPGGGKRLTLFHNPPADKPQIFQAVETFELGPGNTYSHSLSYEYSGEEDAIIEWAVARLSAMPLIGRPFRAVGTPEDADAIIEGRVPMNAASSNIQESMLAREFREITFESRLGPVTIKPSGPNDLWLFDYRKNRWADSAIPFFWLGRYERPLMKNTPWSLTVSMDFPDAPRQRTARPAMTLAIATTAVPDALAPNHDPVSVVPVPQKQTFTGRDMPLNDKTPLVIAAHKTPELENAVALFLGDLKAQYDLELNAKWITPGEGPGDVIPFGAIELSKVGDVVISEGDFPPPADEPEGYALRVDDKGALLRANTDAGLQHGLMSLLQLVKVTKTGLFLKGAEIRDWPALKFRGVHCLSGKNAGDQIAKMIRAMMARHKMNALVWQCEYLIWDCAPELEHPEFGMTKADARQVIDAARATNIELIPLVQSLGHSEWIFTNKQNLDIAEDPDEPYAYSPIVLRTYDFIFEVYQEALDFFQPRRFHIGHDEVTMTGEFPKRSKESGLSVTELIMYDTLKLYRWFKAKNIGVMQWGDMHIYKTEAPDAGLAPTLWDARVRRELLPRDVEICDWHYGAFEPERFTSLGLFKREGFPTIACAWYLPNNIRNLAVAAVQNEIDGFLQTTWAGFNFKIDGNEEAWFQYWAYLWAAHYSWNGQNVAIEDLPFDAREYFFDLWFERRPRRTPREGFVADLTPLYNVRLADDGKDGGWVGIGEELDLRAFAAESGLFRETRFHLGAGPNGERALMLAGLMNPDGDFPSEVTIPLGDRKASELHLLMTAAFSAADRTKTGDVVFEYDGGETAGVDLEYYRNVFAFNDPRSSREARVAWQGKSLDGTMVRVFDVTIANPHPERAIKAVTLKAAGTEAAPVLFALTCVK